LERIGDVTDVTLVTLLTVASCTDKDKLCTVDIAGTTDQIKRKSFRYQIIDKVGPVAILPGSSLAEEF
jgi:septum formation inhibitor-activating ATPase MinD